LSINEEELPAERERKITTERGMRHVLTCQDNLSKYFIATPLENQTSGKVTEAFVKNVILVYGVPSELVTDQGTNFMGEVFKRICRLLKIEKICTEAYHPGNNGALERTHKTLTKYQRCFCEGRTSDWDKWIPFACFVYNTTPHSVTKYTPDELLFGRVASIPGELQREPQPVCDCDEVLASIKQRMQSCQQVARERDY
jgi:hypothetical protein